MKVFEAQISYTTKEIESVLLDRPQAIADFSRKIYEGLAPVKEHVVAIALNRKNFYLGHEVISTGTLTSSLCTPRDVFRFIFLHSASAFVLVHNHPSGDVNPSGADIELTRVFRESARLLSVEFLDHVILGDGKHYSFRESGFM